MVIQTECGLVLIIGKNPQNYKLIFESLKKLQHRGRESFGIGYINKQNNTNYTNIQKLNIEKYMGEVVEEKIQLEHKKILSNVWYGHVRYSTSGIKTNQNTTIKFTQPIQYSLFNLDDVNIIYNGNIPLFEWSKVFKNNPELNSYYQRNKENINDTYLILEYLKILKNKQYQKKLAKTHNSNQSNHNKIILNILIEFVNSILYGSYY